MRVAQQMLSSVGTGLAACAPLVAISPQLLLVFGSVSAMQVWAPVIRRAFPAACMAGCSTSGEISNHGVSDDGVVLTAISFSRSHVAQCGTVLQKMGDSREAGRRLAQGLEPQGLRAVLVFGQGVHINGSGVLAGMSDVLDDDIPVAGGLAGDGGAFSRTWVLDDSGVSSDRLVCVGLYGSALSFTQGTFGGWSPFGPARKVTRCAGNVLFELDDEPALAVYKRYLGEHANGLPASGLLFPFAMLGQDHAELGLIRTILGINEVDGSLTLAGEIDEHGYLKLMHAGTDALVDGAHTAAERARGIGQGEGEGQSLALLVSCVGRKLVMGGRVDEEVEAVAEAFGESTVLAGFYSNGEFGPQETGKGCRLHNQTMAISFIREA